MIKAQTTQEQQTELFYDLRQKNNVKIDNKNNRFISFQ